jgi:hypothetical protein
MTHSVSSIDRIRIERLVWALDQRIYDLPRRSRIAMRREVRDNLLAAAHDVGTTEALRRVGTSHELARQYLTAEFGDGLRHSWMAASLYCAGFPPLVNFFLGEVMSGYQAGITAGSPHAAGTFTWSGVSYLQHPIVYTFAGGHAGYTGGDWSLVCYAAWLAGTILAGRLWRLRPLRIRRREHAAS